MVGEVHHRRFVRPGQIGYFERVFVIEIERGLDVQFAGVILVAVLRKERHDHAVGLHTALPDAVGEVLRAAVQVVGAVVHFERVLLSLDGHAAESDAVGAAAHALARRGSVEEVAFGMLVTQHHVGHAALAVGHRDGDDGGPEIRDFHFGALIVAHRVEDDGFALRRHAPYVLFDLYHYSAGFLRLRGYGRCGAGSLRGR